MPEVFASAWARTSGDIVASMRAALEAHAMLGRRPALRAYQSGDEWLEARARGIVGALASRAGLSTADLFGRSREARICRERQDAMTLVRELIEMSLPAIGKLFGHRDHSTVCASIDATKLRRMKRPDEYAAKRRCAEAALAEGEARSAA